MDSKFRPALDRLDQALLERALESARVAVKGDNILAAELDSDEELEATLRRELVEIALPTASETLKRCGTFYSMRCPNNDAQSPW